MVGVSWERSTLPRRQVHGVRRQATVGTGRVQRRGRVVTRLRRRGSGPHGPGPHHTPGGERGRRGEIPTAAGRGGPGRVPQAEVAAQLMVHALHVVRGHPAVLAKVVLAARDEGGVGPACVAPLPALLALLGTPLLVAELVAHLGQPALPGGLADALHVLFVLAQVDGIPYCAGSQRSGGVLDLL